jgi:hypothetical protein
VAEPQFYQIPSILTRYRRIWPLKHRIRLRIQPKISWHYPYKLLVWSRIWIQDMIESKFPDQDRSKNPDPNGSGFPRLGKHIIFMRGWLRVETKNFIFVFSRKFIFALWENGRKKWEILWNILRCQIPMVLQNKSDNSNGHALLYCLLRMVLQNKSDICTVHALQNC